MKNSVNCNLSLTVRSENINFLEARIRKEVRAKGKELLRKTLFEIEKKALNEVGRKCRCGGTKSKYGRIKKEIKTLVGEVEIKRQRLRCLKCKRDYYPLDETLGLNSKRSTMGIKEQSLDLATDIPYDRASEIQKKLAGINITGRQIQNWAKAEGKKVKEKIKKEREKIFDKGEIPESLESRGRVFVQVDGTFVKDRSKPRAMECKLGIIYSKKAKVSKDRYEILDKRTFATTEGIESFREEFIAECNKWGVFEAEEILFVGDGARWIKRFCGDAFPNAVYLLDLWHLADHIAGALGEDHSRAADNWIEEVKRTCDAELLLGRIKGLYTRIRDPDRQEKLRDLYNYVSNNREGIENWGRVDYLGASGAVEKAVDVTIARRFKKRGMSWLSPGLSGLLALRVLKINGEWSKYWQEKGVPA